ncbi:two pore segment channel 3 [Corythoichthys intestinalis]|uniref:two pore segment channel 3 n=1 Tax=Corythoichthys intestinalis TaxID=161448 RepID=UPI0025A67508|nr:two pore segment channel 3 [Corythoichthys intestinalis]XP_061792113.1 two pore calcium channel protein 1-like [Nerophis lumbriciformis]
MCTRGDDARTLEFSEVREEKKSAMEEDEERKKEQTTTSSGADMTSANATSSADAHARARAGKETKSKEDLDLASAYVSDAQYNRNIFFDTSPQAVRLYLLYNRRLPQVLLYFFILLDLSLALCEEPAVWPLPPWATMLVELVCLHVFALRLVHYAKVIPRDKFWKDPKNICIIAVLVLTLADMIICGALHAAGIYFLRCSRVLRPLLLVNVTEGRQLRRAFRSIRNALPQIMSVFLLFIFSILIFSLMALKLFSKRGLKTADGAPYFSNYLDAVFDLYVLVTTANSPDVMMPAYDAGSAFAIFFIVYILVNTYIFMSVFLAVVFNNYKKYLKEEVRQLVRAKRHKMARAFAVLQEPPEDGDGEPVVSREVWKRLVRLVQPDISRAHTELLWCVSDDGCRGTIGKTAFVQLCDLLNIQVITLKSRPHPLGHLCPALYHSAPSRLLCRWVRHRAFTVVYDIIIVINAVFIGLDEDDPNVANSEWAFLALYLLEILLKLYVIEPRTFFSRHSFWNWFDTIIVVCALVATIVNATMESSGAYSSRQILDIVFILRVLRLVRVVDSIQRFRAIVNTLIRIGPAILTFAQLILVVYYVFAVVGMELFKGKVQFYEDPDAPGWVDCGNRLLRGSAFAKLKYCKNNFNDVLSSFVLLLELTVVNQWHVLSSGFAAVTHKSARIYFVLFHITVVIVIINIFVAFVLEAFFLEYSLDKSDLHTELEKKIEELRLGVAQEMAEDNLLNAMETSEQPGDASESGRPQLLFKIASKRYRTVDALLQRLFEADVERGEPDGADDIVDGNGNFANPSFNAA